MKKAMLLLLFVGNLFFLHAQGNQKPQIKGDTVHAEAAQALTPTSLDTGSATKLAELEAERMRQERDYSHEGEVFRTGAVIFTMVVIMIFIVVMVKTYMDYKLRHKILDNNVQADSLQALLDITPRDRKVSNLRWVFILAGVGFGLHLGGMVRIGIHSVAIMCLCLAASFLAFHFFVLRKS